MRALLLLLVLARTAQAGPFIEVLGGLAAPIADDTWKNSVGASPELAGRLGTCDGSVGIALSLDGTYIRARSQPGEGLSGERVRVLANLELYRPLGDLHFSARVAIGVDTASLQRNVVFEPNDGSANTGFAAEAAFAFWYPATARTWLGAEVAVPYSLHADGIEYTSVDVVVLFGLRRQ